MPTKPRPFWSRVDQSGARLGFGQGVLAIFVWPYYLGDRLVQHLIR